MKIQNHKINTLVVLVMVSLLVLMFSSVNGQYIHMVEYQSMGCVPTAFVRATSVVPNVCYSTNSTANKSFYVVFDGSQFNKTIYSTSDCQPGYEISTNTYMLNACSPVAPYMKLYASPVPIIPSSGFGYYERHVENSCSGINTTQSQRVSFKYSTCANSDLNEKTFATSLSNMTLNLLYSSSNCASTGLTYGVSCDSSIYNPNIYNAFSAPPPLPINFVPVLTDYGSITIGGLKTAWPAIGSLEYAITTTINSVTNVLSCRLKTETDYCSLNSLGDGVLVGIQLSIVGQDYLGAAPANSSKSIITPTGPAKPNVYIISQTSSSVTILYNSTFEGFYSRSYYVFLDGTAQSCNTYASQCTITATSGTHTIDVYIVNGGRQSPTNSQTITFAPVNPLTSPVISATNIGIYDITITYSTTGGTGSINYTTTANGVTYCYMSYSTTCQLTSLSPSTIYHVNVVAGNGFEESQSTSPFQTYAALNSEQANITSTTSTSIGLSYSVNGGANGKTLTTVQYAIAPVAGTYQNVSTCTNTKSSSCIVGGLQSGTQYDFRVCFENSGDISYAYVSGSTNQSLVITSLTASQTGSNSIVISYSSTGAAPNTTYQVTVDGIIKCASQSLSCPVAGLSIATHTIIVAAGSGPDTSSKQLSFTLQNIYLTVNFTYIGITKYRLIFVGTYPPNQTVSYKICNLICSDYASGVVQEISGLTADTSYQVSVIMTLNSVDYVGFNGTIKTYPSLSLTQDITQNDASSFYINYHVGGGVPTLGYYYTTYISGLVYPPCKNITSNICGVTLNGNYSTYSMTLQVNNEYAWSVYDVQFTAYQPPAMGVILPTVSTTFITLNWSGGTGGKPASTTFKLKMSFQGSAYVDICTPLELSNRQCNITGLIPNTDYKLLLQLFNAQFQPVESYLNYTTLALNITDIPVCVDGCLNGGTCQMGVCECINGWTGSSCETTTKNAQQTVMSSSPNTTQVTMKNQGVSLNFALDSITEKNPSTNVVYQTQLMSQIQWVAKPSLSTVTNPSSQSRLQREQVVYSTESGLTTAQAINVTFSQYHYLDGPFTDHAEMKFAGQSFDVTVGALKYNVDVQQWTFQSTDNVLEFTTNLELPSLVSSSLSSNSSLNITNGIDMTSIVVYDSVGNQVYIRLLNRVLLDGLPMSITHQVGNFDKVNGLVTFVTTIPYFKQSLSYDPDLSLLVTYDASSGSSEEDSSSKGFKAAQIGIIVGVIGGAIVITIAIVIYLKNRTKIRVFTSKLKTRKMTRYN